MKHIILVGMVKSEFGEGRITGAHLRAARALLGVSADTFAQAAGVGVATVRRHEARRDAGELSSGVELQLKAALEAYGVKLLYDRDGGVGAQIQSSSSSQG